MNNVSRKAGPLGPGKGNASQRERGKVFARGGKQGVLLTRKQEKAERERGRLIPLLKVPRPTTVICVTGWGLTGASNTDHADCADARRATSVKAEGPARLTMWTEG